MKTDYENLVMTVKQNNCLPSWNDLDAVVVLQNAQKYLKLCYIMADAISHDPRTQIGTVLVGSDGRCVGSGVNSLPIGLTDGDSDIEGTRNSPYCSTELKYTYMEHSERNAIYSAIRSGKPCKDVVMFCPAFSCVECSRAIIQSGIKVVVGHKQQCDLISERWKNSVAIGREMFDKAGVVYCEWDGKIKSNPPLTIQYNGAAFEP
jgi:dCMP deaminase